jgi:hypothetical protein
MYSSEQQVRRKGSLSKGSGFMTPAKKRYRAKPTEAAYIDESDLDDDRRVLTTKQRAFMAYMAFVLPTCPDDEHSPGFQEYRQAVAKRHEIFKKYVTAE